MQRIPDKLEREVNQKIELKKKRIKVNRMNNIKADDMTVS